MARYYRTSYYSILSNYHLIIIILMKKINFLFSVLVMSMMATVAFAQPANDDCSTAIALTIAADQASCVPTAATTVAATPSAASQYVCSGTWFADDVWFSFTTGATAPANGVTVELGGAIPTFGMAMYLGCGIDEIPFNCFSDGLGTVTEASLRGVQPNTTYYVRVWSGGGTNTNSGTFEICVFENAADTAVVLFEEDFSDPNLTGWTQSGTPNGAAWLWSPVVDPGAGAYSGDTLNNTLFSPSACNGGILFDSDFYDNNGTPGNFGNGPHPAPQANILESSDFDCSGASAVVLEFYQVLRQFTSTYTVSYSIDGGANFIDVPVNGQYATNSAHIQERLEIPLFAAAGESQVRVRFTYDANYYYWGIDDIRVLSVPDFSDVTIANNWYAIAPTYSMPKDQRDSVRFMADVANIGFTPLTNVTLNVDVVRASDGATVHTDSHNYGTFALGDTVENFIFPTAFYPDTTEDVYTATYTLVSDSSDYTPENNTASFSFAVGVDTFRKVAVADDNVAAGGDDSWTYGTHFRVANGSGVDASLDTTIRYASGFTFGIANADQIDGQSVILRLEKGYDVNDDGEIAADERIWVAFASHAVQAADAGQLITVPLQAAPPAAPGTIYELEDNENYILSVQYDSPTGSGDLMRIMTSDVAGYAAADFAAEQRGFISYNNIIDVGNTGDYSTGNFSGDPTPAIELVTTTVVLPYFSDVNEQLSVEALNIFPNPANNVITADINMDVMAQDVAITIFDIQGKVVETRQLANVQAQQVTFDVSNYANGAYMMSIVTENGYTAKRFVVAK